MYKTTKFDLLEYCLKQSGRETALGRQQLFFRQENNIPDKLSSRLSDTINLG